MMREWSDGAPRRSGCWKSGVGTLGEYLRGKRTPSQQEVCVIAYFLPLSGVALGIVAKASDLNSNFDFMHRGALTLLPFGFKR